MVVSPVNPHTVGKLDLRDLYWFALTAMGLRPNSLILGAVLYPGQPLGLIQVLLQTRWVINACQLQSIVGARTRVQNQRRHGIR